jgi:hypothetical protein
MYNRNIMAMALLVAASLITLSSAAMGESTPVWQRAWVMDGFDCAYCSREERTILDKMRGQSVVFGTTAFTNPFYESCPVGVDYGDIRPRSAAEARALLGSGSLPPLIEASPLAGLIRCADRAGPPNTIARVVIDGTNAFVLHESGAILHLH